VNQDIRGIEVFIVIKLTKVVVPFGRKNESSGSENHEMVDWLSYDQLFRANCVVLSSLLHVPSAIV
jgi:hypothetical protein